MKKSLNIIGFSLGLVVLLTGCSNQNLAPSENPSENIVNVEAVTDIQTVEEKDNATDESIRVICKLSAYCKENYPHICNDGDSSRTATGTTPTVGRTVAVDPSVFPYGSELTSKGHTYIAEDCGGDVKGNHIDILFATHEEALNFGIQFAEVSYVVKESN